MPLPFESEARGFFNAAAGASASLGQTFTSQAGGGANQFVNSIKSKLDGLPRFDPSDPSSYPPPRELWDQLVGILMDIWRDAGLGPLPGGSAGPAPVFDASQVAEQLARAINKAEEALNPANFVITSGTATVNLHMKLGDLVEGPGAVLSFNFAPRPHD